MQNNVVDKNSPEYQLKQINGARYSLLLILIFTVVNLVMLFLDGNTYFLFSASVPYYLTAFCMGMDYGLTGAYFGTFTIIALVVAVVSLGLYLLCWLMSKKKGGWFIVALVFFILDTLALLGVSLIFNMLGDNVLDFVFHGWVIFELIQAIIANGKLKKLAAAPAMPQQYPQYPQYPQSPQNGTGNSNGPEF